MLKSSQELGKKYARIEPRNDVRVYARKVALNLARM